MTDAQTTAINPAQPAGTLAASRERFTATLLDEIEPIPCEIEYDLTNAKEKAHEIIGYVESHFAQAKQSAQADVANVDAAAKQSPAASASAAS
jgi:hypothetical protein